MKTLLTAIHSKFIHAGLAMWYLKAACGSCAGDVEVAEYSVNDVIDGVFESIYSKKPDCIGISCYVWNIAYVLRLASDLKKVLPQTIIILGGPEVSFDQEKILAAHSYIDIVLAGEGEETFKAVLAEIILNGGNYNLSGIPGVAFRKGDEIRADTTYQMVRDLDSIPSPFTDEMLQASKNKALIYIEGSRGCQFSCSYCQSSTFHGVRNFSLQRVKDDIGRILGSGFKQIKFVDRTINCDRKRFAEIVGFIDKLNTDATFHFEAGGDLFDDGSLNLLASLPRGRVQLEIGVQTLNEKSLEYIGRLADSGKLLANIRNIIRAGNIAVHLDLIAGLPYETADTFISSFNNTYELTPHQLQLGFLKLLPGTELRTRAVEHEYEYRDYAPYEIISNKYTSADEIIELKNISELIEIYYNSGRFTRTLDSIIRGFFESPFCFYDGFNKYNRKNQTSVRQTSMQNAYEVLIDYLKSILSESDMQNASDLLTMDFFLSNSSKTLPSSLQSESSADFKEKRSNFLKNSDLMNIYLTAYSGMSSRQIYKSLYFAAIGKKNVIYAFDYARRDKVTGKYDYTEITLEDFK